MFRNKDVREEPTVAQRRQTPTSSLGPRGVSCSRSPRESLSKLPSALKRIGATEAVASPSCAAQMMGMLPSSPRVRAGFLRVSSLLSFLMTRLLMGSTVRRARPSGNERCLCSTGLEQWLCHEAVSAKGTLTRVLSASFGPLLFRASPATLMVYETFRHPRLRTLGGNGQPAIQRRSRSKRSEWSNGAPKRIPGGKVGGKDVLASAC